MRTGPVSALLLVLSLPAPAVAGPRERLDTPSIITPPPGGAHDVVEAAGIGLTVGLLAHVIEPRVLRAERVILENEPIWRVDVAGRIGRDRPGCSAVAAWISESGRVLRLAQMSEEAPLDDCRAWYFDGDELAVEAAKDVDPRDGWTGPPEETYRDEAWDDETMNRWDDWMREVRGSPDEGAAADAP